MRSSAGLKKISYGLPMTSSMLAFGAKNVCAPSDVVQARQTSAALALTGASARNAELRARLPRPTTPCEAMVTMGARLQAMKRDFSFLLCEFTVRAFSELKWCASIAP